MSTKGASPNAAKASTGGKKKRPAPAIPRPSSSIILLSPTNQVLLLHRVHTSTSFASAHVFPGGNLSTFHEGELPPPEATERHQDSDAYRLAAVRETFEESGILLAKRADGGGGLLQVPDAVMEEGRKLVHSNKVRFGEWVKALGGVPDTAGLMPFTRWITPSTVPKRFTTQMYIYMPPLAAAQSTGPQREAIIPTPTHDGGIEHTAATFDDPGTWLEKARRNEITLLPPQMYLLNLVNEHLTLNNTPSGPLSREYYQAQRDSLVAFLKRVPTSPPGAEKIGKTHPTANIPWAEKVIGPTVLFVRSSDNRTVMGLDKPGDELAGTGRGGDWDRVTVVRFAGGAVKDGTIMWRDEALREEKEALAKQEKEGPKL